MVSTKHLQLNVYNVDHGRGLVYLTFTKFWQSKMLQRSYRCIMWKCGLDLGGSEEGPTVGFAVLQCRNESFYYSLCWIIIQNYQSVYTAGI